MSETALEISLSELEDRLAKKKAQEKRIVEERRDIEREILTHKEVLSRIKDEGTTSFGTLSIQTGYTRTWDQALLMEMRKDIKDEFLPFRAELKEDRKASRVIEERFPDLWRRLSTALTLKPKKPQLTIKTETEN